MIQQNAHKTGNKQATNNNKLQQIPIKTKNGIDAHNKKNNTVR